MDKPHLSKLPTYTTEYQKFLIVELCVIVSQGYSKIYLIRG